MMGTIKNIPFSLLYHHTMKKAILGFAEAATETACTLQK